MLQQTPLDMTDAPPSADIYPPLIADELVTEETGVVVIVGS